MKACSFMTTNEKERVRMDGYRRHYLTINREDYERANTILEEYYYRGDIENITIETDIVRCTVKVGLQCSTDDLTSLENEFQKIGITVV